MRLSCRELGFMNLIVDGEEIWGFNVKRELGFWIVRTEEDIDRFNISV